MRVVLVLLCLQGLAAFAQIGRTEGAYAGPRFDWTMGVHRSQPTLSVRAEGSKDGRPSLVDSDSDLGLGRRETPLGFFLEHPGEIHGFHLGYDTYQFEGEQTLPRDIQLDGTSYRAGSGLHSKAKGTVLEGIYTYKFMRQADAWVGFDLGAQYLKTDLSATTLGPSPSTQAVHPTLLLPQLGLSGWSCAADGLLEYRGFYHYLKFRGVTYTRYGLDARAYLYPGFGLRAFFEKSAVSTSAGASLGDLNLRADSKMSGLGLVIRF